MVKELTRNELLWLRQWLKRVHYGAEKEGCKGEEIMGFIMHKWENCKLKRVKVEYYIAMDRIIPWLVKNIDIKNNKGEKLEFDVECDKFARMMGREFADMDYARISSNIRRSLLRHGLNVKILIKKRVKHYMFYALNDDEVKRIEERIGEGVKRRFCRQIVRKVCDTKLREDYDDELKDSIWADPDFVKTIVGCNFDVDKLNEKIKKEKDRLLYEKIKYGFEVILR